MAGLFGWFNGNKNQDASVQTNANKPVAYFLEADDAKTFGDIEYMRTAKVVKRTFPKTFSSPKEFERVESVSALGKMAVNGNLVDVSQVLTQNGASSNGATSNGTAANGASEPLTDRRRSDTSMDMFRSMARDMRKR
ncbi:MULTISPECIES: hypothetical protein [unclassified Leptolyngbya]|uniref:hypothetical protein n=1 Tax=unclassified Leptolyngbya TaxID=2650499 RepID=UPI001686A9C1|nr:MULTISPECIES: hypothetical protein [unclassified Leptolyngbya]MBD1912016.1 hypothetical protein [Leptolyngbya sp. FACHB-8]MBD2155386.1 hypothetical protein [Leptolyngbya sp. FACHB-16]